jgi:phosphatidate cytidylyltransferase
LKELLTRTVTGSIFLVLILGSILWSPYAFLAVAGIFSMIGLYEFFRLFYPEHKINDHIAFYASGAFIYLITGLTGIGIFDVRMMIFVMILFYISILLELFRKDSSWNRIAVYFAAFIYVSFSFGLLNALYFMGNQSGDTFFPSVLLGIFLLVWSNDIFAYLVGSSIGKNRLFERHSPKKSWEGSFGGLIFAMGMAWVLSIFLHQLTAVQWIITAAIVVVFGTLGDLAESLLKRNKKVKDSGTIFPGHGGVLDRFDAVIFAAPFVFLYINFFVR